MACAKMAIRIIIIVIMVVILIRLGPKWLRNIIIMMVIIDIAIVPITAISIISV